MDIGSLTGILLNIHATLAALSHTPEFALTEDEAKSLATALALNARHYNLPSIAPKITDGVNLLMVLMAVYGTRFAAIKIRRARETEPEPAPMMGVVPLHHGFSVGNS